MKIRIYDFPYINMSPIDLYKALADDTRLKSVLLIFSEQELCVCELTAALGLSQPKISRHLAQLKKVMLLSDRRQGQWIYYRINEDIPDWAKQVIATTLSANQDVIAAANLSLARMGDRPMRKQVCC